MAEGQCSGPCNSVCRFHVMRAPLTLTLYRVWTWWSPKKRSSCFCQTESASTQTVKGFFQHRMYIQRSVALWCRLIFPSICSRTEILFGNRNFVREPNRFYLQIFVQKPNCSNSETFENRGLTVQLSGKRNLNISFLFQLERC